MLASGTVALSLIVCSVFKGDGNPDDNYVLFERS